jgi:hypothetical protein
VRKKFNFIINNWRMNSGNKDIKWLVIHRVSIEVINRKVNIKVSGNEKVLKKFF